EAGDVANADKAARGARPPWGQARDVVLAERHAGFQQPQPSRLGVPPLAAAATPATTTASPRATWSRRSSWSPPMPSASRCLATSLGRLAASGETPGLRPPGS